MQQKQDTLSLSPELELEQLKQAYVQVLAEKNALEMRVRKGEERRRALLHILNDLHTLNHKLANQRKAMIHIMSDLRETTEEVQRREQELREKQELLVQAGKLATLGELTTGVAHELNNPLNNIGLFVGNAIDLIELGLAETETERILQEQRNAMQQVHKATEIISHLRTFGRAATVSREPVELLQIIRRSISLMGEQLRLRQIAIKLNFPEPEDAVMVIGNAIQLEQVFINLLSNARDALLDAVHKCITINCTLTMHTVKVCFRDTGPGIPQGLEQRIFDPFFTTKEVGRGTGLGLSITYGIIKEHQGSITIENHPGRGAHFLVQLPLMASKEKE